MQTADDSTRSTPPPPAEDDSRAEDGEQLQHIAPKTCSVCLRRPCSIFCSAQLYPDPRGTLPARPPARPPLPPPPSSVPPSPVPQRGQPQPPPAVTPLRPARAYRMTRLRREAFYYDVSELAAALSWPVWRVRRHLKKSKALVKRGGRYYTTKSLLRRALPHESPELIAILSEKREPRRPTPPDEAA